MGPRRRSTAAMGAGVSASVSSGRSAVSTAISYPLWDLRPSWPYGPTTTLQFETCGIRHDCSMSYTAADLEASAAVSKVSLPGLRRRSPGRADPDFDRRVVWMLGSPRSGSTWLLYLLAEHDAIVPMNEPLIGWYLGPFMGDVPGLSARDFDIDNFTVRRSHEHKAPHFFATDFEGAWMPPLATLLRVRLNAHVERFPPAVGADRALLLVKEPNGSQSADILLRAMPESRLVFLLRDGRDVVDSELASIAKGSWVTREFGVRGLEGEQRLEFVTEHAMKWLWRTQVVQDAY